MTWNEIYFFSYRHWILSRCSQILSSRDDDSTANNGSMKTSHNFFITFPPHSLIPHSQFLLLFNEFFCLHIFILPHHAHLSFHHMAFSGREEWERDYCGATGKFIHFFPPSTHPLPDAFRWQQQLQQQVRVFPSSSIFCTPLETMAMFQMRKTATNEQQQRDGHEFPSSSSLACQLGFCGWNVFHYHVFQPHARATSDLISMTLWYFPSSIARVVVAVHFVSSVDIACQNNGCFLPQPHSTTQEHNNSLLFFTFFYRFTPVELLTRTSTNKTKGEENGNGKNSIFSFSVFSS